MGKNRQIFEIFREKGAAQVINPNKISKVLLII
jgi:hypothetical protein